MKHWFKLSYLVVLFSVQAFAATYYVASDGGVAD